MSEETVSAVTEDFDWDSDAADFPSVEAEGEGESGAESEDWMAEASEEAPAEETKVEEVEASEDSGEDKPSGEESGSKEEEQQKEEAFDIESLSDDAMIKVKVDGELQEISLKDFKNGISGEKAIAKRFSEYDRKEKQFKSEMDEVNAYVNEFASKMQSGDVVSALEYMAQFSNVPAYQVKDMLIEKLMPEIERRYELSEDQLLLEKEQARIDYEKKITESESKKVADQQATMELENKISLVQRSYNISQEDWNEAFEYLDETLPADENITIDTVKEYVLFSRATDALSEVDSALSENKAILSEFVDLQEKNPDFTKEDLMDIAKEAFGYVKQESASQELQEAKEQKEKGNRKQQKKKEVPSAEELGISEPESDDWDDLL